MYSHLHVHVPTWTCKQIRSSLPPINRPRQPIVEDGYPHPTRDILSFLLLKRPIVEIEPITPWTLTVRNCGEPALPWKLCCLHVHVHHFPSSETGQNHGHNVFLVLTLSRQKGYEPSLLSRVKNRDVLVAALSICSAGSPCVCAM